MRLSERRIHAVVLGQVISYLRTKQGLTQAELAQQATGADLVQSTISRLERGEAEVGVFALQRIASALDVKVSVIESYMKDATILVTRALQHPTTLDRIAAASIAELYKES